MKTPAIKDENVKGLTKGRPILSARRTKKKKGSDSKVRNRKQVWWEHPKFPNKHN